MHIEPTQPWKSGVLSETFYHHAGHSSQVDTAKRGFSGESLPSKDPDLSSYLHTKIARHLKIAALLIKYLKNISIPPGNQQYAYC